MQQKDGGSSLRKTRVHFVKFKSCGPEAFYEKHMYNIRGTRTENRIKNERKVAELATKWSQKGTIINTYPFFSFLSFHLYSSFPDSKEQYPNFALKNGGVAGSEGGMELKRSVGAHCHGANKATAATCEDSADKLLAKKKLYIASAVCLVFMIGEVIGERAAG